MAGSAWGGQRRERSVVSGAAAVEALVESLHDMKYASGRVYRAVSVSSRRS